MNDEAARQGRPDTNQSPAFDDSRANGARQLDSFIRERNAALTREARMLRAELKRTERLLAMALRIASRDGEACDPLELLKLIGALLDEDLARPAWKRDQEIDGLVALVRPLRCERDAA